MKTKTIQLDENQTIDYLVAACTAKFRSFGGGKTSNWNPISQALRDKPPQFAAGVDIREVVEFIVKELE